jgi:hypothetical protein
MIELAEKVVPIDVTVEWSEAAYGHGRASCSWGGKTRGDNEEGSQEKKERN